MCGAHSGSYMLCYVNASYEFQSLIIIIIWERETKRARGRARERERRWLYIRSNKCPTEESFISRWHIFRQLNDWCASACKRVFVSVWKSAIDFLFPMHSQQKWSELPSFVSQINSRHSFNSSTRSHTFWQNMIIMNRKKISGKKGCIGRITLSPKTIDVILLVERAERWKRIIIKVCMWNMRASVWRLKYVKW